MTSDNKNGKIIRGKFRKKQIPENDALFIELPELSESSEENDTQATMLLSEDNPTGNVFLHSQIEGQPPGNQLSPGVPESKKLRIVADDRLSPRVDYFQRWFAAVNLAALPFHHLIPAAKLTFASALKTPGKGNDLLNISRSERLQIFWQSLAFHGMSPKEAALFEDSLKLYFKQDVDAQTIDVDWEVNYFDELQGCGEIYRAEMLLFKRRVYEAGENLRTVLEFTGEDLAPYLDQSIFAKLSKNTAENLFFDALMAPFNLTVSGLIQDDPEKSSSVDIKYKKQAKQNRASNSEGVAVYKEFMSKRIKEFLMRSSEQPIITDENISGKIYNVKLSPYWLLWQRSARIANFDFDYLEKIEDARAIRFYELTKLWRVPTPANENAKMPDKLEIDYEKFASLMPLPKLNFEEEVIEQIRRLIKPLKIGGYVKSFRVGGDQRKIATRNLSLIFRFND